MGVAIVVVDWTVTVDVVVTGVATREQADELTVAGYLVRTSGVEESRFSTML